MQREREPDRARDDRRLRTDDRPAAEQRRSRPHDELRTEDVHIRSYDHWRSYDIRVEIRTRDGIPVFERRYDVAPGRSTGELDTLPDGEYEIVVTAGDDRCERVQCRIGASPDHTVVIEVGNGVLSVTKGLRP
jgi:hypothetical protein